MTLAARRAAKRGRGGLRFMVRSRRLVAIQAGFAAALALLIPGTGRARELAPAPEVRIIGFSADGRYFAYEQFEDDAVSDTAIAAVDVIERESGASARGFPFGFLGISRAGDFPARVGRHTIAIKQHLSGDARLAALRREVAQGSRGGLAALGIGTAGRRLAGFTITDRRRRGCDRIRARAHLARTRAGHADRPSGLGARRAG